MADAANAITDLVARLVEARRRQGATQLDVAEALGLTPMSVSGWEQGEDAPTPAHLIRWARALGCTVRVVDQSGCWLWARPAPSVGETPEEYWIRCTILILRETRQEAGLLQRHIAERIGVSEWTVQMWENGRRLPLLRALTDWCAALGCRLELRGR